MHRHGGMMMTTTGIDPGMVAAPGMVATVVPIVDMVIRMVVTAVIHTEAMEATRMVVILMVVILIVIISKVRVNPLSQPMRQQHRYTRRIPDTDTDSGRVY